MSGSTESASIDDLFRLGRASRDRWPAGSLMFGLSESTRSALIMLGTRRVHADGDRLIRERETGDHVFLLLQGWFKVVAATEDGREALLSIRAGGDLVGELAVLDGQRRSATVKAAGPGVSRQIGRTAFLDFLAAHDDASRAVMRAVAGKLRWATRRRHEFATCTVQVRVPRVLAELARAYGRPDPRGIAIGVTLTQPDVAALVGAAEPSVHRVLTDLRRRGVISTGYRKIVVQDVDELSRAAGLQPDLDDLPVADARLIPPARAVPTILRQR